MAKFKDRNIVIRDNIIPKTERFSFKVARCIEREYLVTVGYLVHIKPKDLVCEVRLSYRNLKKCPTFEQIFNDFLVYCRSHVLPDDHVEIISLDCERCAVNFTHIEGSAFILKPDICNNVDITL